MAVSLLRAGKSVILCGRTESNLQSTVSELSAQGLPGKVAGYYVLDVSKTAELSAFVDRLLHDHPDLDCLVNNAGVQRPFQVLGPDYSFDLAKADAEIDTDIRAPMHLSVLLVQKQLAELNDGKGGGCLMNVSSILGFNPFSVINPVYNGCKSWVHFFSLNLRTQLKQAGKNVKVVEIVPPSVSTGLHRERVDPSDNEKAKKQGSTSVLSLEEFMQEVDRQWEEGKDVVTAGPGFELVKKWEEGLGEMYRKAVGE